MRYQYLGFDCGTTGSTRNKTVRIEKNVEFAALKDENAAPLNYEGSYSE